MADVYPSIVSLSGIAVFDFLQALPLRTLRKSQTYLNIAITICAFASIALTYASQGTLALLLLVPTAVLCIAAVVLAVQLYKINQRKRAEVLAQNAGSLDPELLAIIDARDDTSAPDAQLNKDRPASTGRWNTSAATPAESSRSKKR